MLSEEVVPFILIFVNYFVWFGLVKVLRRFPAMMKTRLKKSLENTFLGSGEGFHLIVLSFVVLGLISLVWWLADLSLSKASMSPVIPLAMDIFLVLGIIIGVFVRVINPQLLKFSKKDMQLRPLVVRFARSGQTAGMYGLLLLFVWNFAWFGLTKEESFQFLQSPKIWPVYIAISAIAAALGISMAVIGMCIAIGLVNPLEKKEMSIYILEYLTKSSNSEDSTRRGLDLRMMISEAATCTAQFLREKLSIIQDVRVNEPFELVGLGLAWNQETRNTSIDVLNNLVLRINEDNPQECLESLAKINETENFLLLDRIRKMGVTLIQRRKKGKLERAGKWIAVASAILTIINVVITLTGFKF